jgi:hypothetical protein
MVYDEQDKLGFGLGPGYPLISERVRRLIHELIEGI